MPKIRLHFKGRKITYTDVAEVHSIPRCGQEIELDGTRYLTVGYAQPPEEEDGVEASVWLQEVTHPRRPEDAPARQYAEGAFVPKQERLSYRAANLLRGVGYFCASAGLLAWSWLSLGAEMLDNRNH